MVKRFKKIYSTSELEDAHVIQALMRRNGVSCWLLRSNGLSVEDAAPLADMGYRLFIPESQFQQAVKLFGDTFNCTAQAPFAGSIDMAFSGRTQSVPQTQLTYDSMGPEEFLWNPPQGDPVGDAWQTESPPICSRCGQKIESGDKYCDNCGEPLVRSDALPTCRKCGHEMRPGSNVCSICGESQ